MVYKGGIYVMKLNVGAIYTVNGEKYEYKGMSGNRHEFSSISNGSQLLLRSVEVEDHIKEIEVA